MTPVEDDLRALLHDRATDDPTNPSRTAEVRSRVRRVRRRRTGAVAACLALVAGGGLLSASQLTEGEPARPAGVPAPPYYAGYRPLAQPGYPFALSPIEFDAARGITYYHHGRYPLLLVVRCTRAGVLQVTVYRQPLADVPCRSRVGDHYEGAASVGGDEAHRMLIPRRGGEPENVGLAPSSQGEWAFAIVEARLITLVTDEVWLDGSEHPAGGQRPLTVPADRPGVAGLFSLRVECTAGVRLTFRVPAGVLGTAVCEPSTIDREDMVYVGVPPEVFGRLHLRPGSTVMLTVVPDDRERNEWRVLWPPLY
jgi:hypothetical protein